MLFFCSDPHHTRPSGTGSENAYPDPARTGYLHPCHSLSADSLHTCVAMILPRQRNSLRPCSCNKKKCSPSFCSLISLIIRSFWWIMLRRGIRRPSHHLKEAAGIQVRRQHTRPTSLLNATLPSAFTESIQVKRCACILNLIRTFRISRIYLYYKRQNKTIIYHVLKVL